MDPLRIIGPAAVINVTFLMNSGADAGLWYVDGNGSASGTETPPGPVAVVESFAGVGAWAGFVAAQAEVAAVTSAASRI
jgi:hypothetical protein